MEPKPCAVRDISQQYKREKEKKKKIAQASLNNISGLAEQKGRTGPTVSVLRTRLDPKREAGGGCLALGSSVETPEEAVHIKYSRPILQFQGFQSGVGAGG